MLGRIQNELFDLGADLATPLDPPPKWEALRMVDSQVERLEAEIDWMNETLKELDSFILPGGSPLSAHLHLARTVARRAEREAVRLVEAGEAVTPAAVRYLNRLSDHLFVAARRANANGADDMKWKPGATR
jgi:cob(I)alamin adenosyltransferase